MTHVWGHKYHTWLKQQIPLKKTCIAQFSNLNIINKSFNCIYSLTNVHKSTRSPTNFLIRYDLGHSLLGHGLCLPGPRAVPGHATGLGTLVKHGPCLGLAGLCQASGCTLTCWAMPGLGSPTHFIPLVPNSVHMGSSNINRAIVGSVIN